MTSDGTEHAEPSVHRSRIETILLDRGVMTEEVLDRVRGRQREAGRSLVDLLLEEEGVDEARLVGALADATGLPVLREEELVADPEVRDLLPPGVTRSLGILPLRVEDGTLLVATGDPFELPAFDRLQSLTDLRIRRALAPPSALRKALSDGEPEEDSLHEFLKHTPVDNSAVFVPVEDPEGEGSAAPGGDDGRALALDGEEEDAPIIRLLNLILADAIRQGASDIHIEPEKDAVRIRFRIDGDLQPALEVPEKIRSRLLARLKIVSGLDIIETRVPQDGRAKVVLEGRSYDLRVSTLPSYFGEKAVIRILDSASPTFRLDRSGIDPPVLAAWRELLHRPQGLLLVTGPTGSGKSTTLYASILELRESTRNIVTVEDPVEYQFPGIVHVPVRSDIGMTFAAALRSILRQDPDIILVGEIRDHETAEVAIRAAMTGHLVLSTLHTNDAVSAVTRILDLGVTPHLLGSSLLGIMAQRLVRTICPHCAEPHAYPPEELAALKVPLPPDVNERTRKGRGCARCRGTGMKGRTAITELVRATPDLLALLAAGAEDEELWRCARKDGTRTLFESGVDKILAGITSPAAVLKVAAPEVNAAPAGMPGARVAAPPAPRDRVCGQCGEKLESAWRLCPFCGAEAPPAPAGPTAVVCDDNAVIRKLVCSALRADFPRICEAENGREALDLVFQVRPDVLVVDQEMPVMTGVEVIRELRSRLETAALPIVMLTSSDSEELEGDVLDLGADDYLQKPITPSRLRTRVKAVLKRRCGRVRAGVPGD